MLYDYSLQVGAGTSHPLDYYKIVDAVAVFSAGGSGDRLTLTLELDARTECPIAPFAKVILSYKPDPDVDALLVWQGIRLNTSWQAGIGAALGHRMIVNCVGPDYFLSAVPFLQNWAIQTDPDHPTIGSTSDEALSAAIVAGPTGSLADMIQEAIDQVATVESSIGTSTTNIPDFTPASEQLKDVTCLEVINRMQAWMPGIQRRWNHATGNLEWHSVLRFGNSLGLPSSDLGVREINLTDMDYWSGTERIDLLVSKYTITYLRKKLVVDMTTRIARLVLQTQVDSATSSNDSPMTKTSVIPLSGVGWNGTDFVAGESFPADGQAKLLLAPFADIYYDLDFRLGEIDWSFKPLELINVMDAVDGFADAWAHIESVTHQLKDDKTMIKAGPPSGVNAVNEITRPAKTRQQAPDNQGQHFGFERPKDPSDGAGTFTKKVLTDLGFINITVKGTASDPVAPFMAGEDDEEVIWTDGDPSFNPAGEISDVKFLTDKGFVAFGVRYLGTEDAVTPLLNFAGGSSGKSEVPTWTDGAPAFNQIKDEDLTILTNDGGFQQVTLKTNGDTIVSGTPALIGSDSIITIDADGVAHIEAVGNCDA